MGHCKLYQTQEEKAVANCAKSKRYHERYRFVFCLLFGLFQSWMSCRYKSNINWKWCSIYKQSTANKEPLTSSTVCVLIKVMPIYLEFTSLCYRRLQIWQTLNKWPIQRHAALPTWWNLGKGSRSVLRRLQMGPPLNLSVAFANSYSKTTTKIGFTPLVSN